MDLFLNLSMNYLIQNLTHVHKLTILEDNALVGNTWFPLSILVHKLHRKAFTARLLNLASACCIDIHVYGLLK